jgi:pyruvate/2-oxoglutarate dehydrogenase complex dihydrolipoamide dehydrogenase (E3) component
LNAKAEKIAASGDDSIILTGVKDTKNFTIEGSEILMAAGRTPQTKYFTTARNRCSYQ